MGRGSRPSPWLRRPSKNPVYPCISFFAPLTRPRDCLSARKEQLTLSGGGSGCRGRARDAAVGGGDRVAGDVQQVEVRRPAGSRDFGACLSLR